MSSTRRADPDLDDLITEITIDCHDEDEQLQAFENAFDEDAHFPCPGTVVGQDVEVLSTATNASRRELIGTCRRNAHSYQHVLDARSLPPDPNRSSHGPHAGGRLRPVYGSSRRALGDAVSRAGTRARSAFQGLDLVEF